ARARDLAIPAFRRRPSNPTILHPVQKAGRELFAWDRLQSFNWTMEALNQKPVTQQLQAIIPAVSCTTRPVPTLAPVFRNAILRPRWNGVKGIRINPSNFWKPAGPCWPDWAAVRKPSPE